MMYGFGGRILTLDLTSGQSRIEEFGKDFARAFLGGNGFAVRLLYERLGPGVEPLGPENAVVFAVGPITDTTVVGNSRCCLGTKSPLTGLFFDSTFGGQFPCTFKRTGFDALVLTGKAARPVYLLDAMADTLPPDLWLTRLEERGPSLRIAGTTYSSVALSDFMANLKASGRFKDVDLVDAKQDLSKSPRTITFEVTCRFEI